MVYGRDAYKWSMTTITQFTKTGRQTSRRMMPREEVSDQNNDIQGGRLALGPLGTGDRNFDAGPSRDLNFDPLSWLNIKV